MPRLVRKKPLFERITAMLNPMDFLLWLSEEIETREWDSALVGTQLGVGMNFVFLLARANSGSVESSDGDIFGDDTSAGWLSYFVSPIIWALVVLSCTNAIYALSRTRKYRLFQSSINLPPATSSARRVKVQSSPGPSTPLRYFADMITSASAESRAHPDKSRDVWELSVWDPLPMTLRLFCLFSPGHVLVYLLFLPLAPLDPQPSVTVFNTVVMQVLLSGQMLVLSSRFAQQAKDNNIVQREVMNEYDTKFVQPRINPTVRDVGTQYSDDQPTKVRELVQVGTPTTLVRHAFLSRPRTFVPTEDASTSQANVAKQQLFTPIAPRRTETVTPSDNPRASLMRPTGARENVPTSVSTNRVSTSTGTGNSKFGGHMGIYNHDKSPLKKTISLNDINGQESSPRNSREMAAYEQRGMARPSSPTKHIDMRRTSGTTTSSTNTSSPFVRGGAARERPAPRW
ncbi:Meiotically up-regulated gene protein [Cladobotryum mycophilum]|uniref:Meiotically up-regulated gene protein n=1 Tax=Cladobotryum mycophilum TaxID=491253 RepID=A0ABR0T2U3_9HYPO